MSNFAKRVSLADLADEDILISGDSLKSWVEAYGLTPEQVVEQLTSWLDELEAIPARSVQPDTKLAQAINIYVAGLPHVQSYLERTLSPVAFSQIDTEVRRRESVAELRFKGSDMWKADAEKRWREAAQVRLNEITEDLSRSTWDSEDCYLRRGGLPAATVA